MDNVVGEIKHLRPTEMNALQKLTLLRNPPRELINPDIAKRVALLSSKLSACLGLILEREGKILYLVVGNKNHIMLPDLGRLRLDQARLRKLRLIVFLPHAEKLIKQFPRKSIIFGRNSIKGSTIIGPVPSKLKVVTMEGEPTVTRQVSSPDIPGDLLTDLEKLRFDALAVIEVNQYAAPGSVSFAYLEPPSSSAYYKQQMIQADRAIGIYRFANLSQIQIDFSDFINQLEARFTNSYRAGHDLGKEHAVLIGAYTGNAQQAQSSMAELLELARTAGVNVLDTVIQRRKQLDPKTVVGKGKIEELALHCLDLGVDILIFDKELAPGQLRSITNLTDLKVIDRSMLILDIFAQRAKSSEGRLQVELAQLKYSLPRLTETDSGLSRLTGGIGGRGPGETKLEVSRRRVRDRITLLEKKIDNIAKQRGVRRQLRQDRGIPVISIVGYTNAGKSTLLNVLTKGEVLVENKLFATLDPSSRRLRFPNDKEVVFVDTVGFIRELPQELVNAFRATLEEVGEADILLHLVDASSSEMLQQIKIVEQTLVELGFAKTPRLLVLNKTDLLSEVEVRTLSQSLGALTISAINKQGIKDLIARLQHELLNSFVGRDPGRFTEINQGQNNFD